MSVIKPLTAGILLGTVGVKILTSREAKNVYAHMTAAVLHGKDACVKQAQVLKENCDDIYQRAVDIKEKNQKYEEDCMIKHVDKGAAAEA